MENRRLILRRSILERRGKERVETFNKLIDLGIMKEHRIGLRRSGGERRIKLIDIDYLEEKRIRTRRKGQKRLSYDYEAFYNMMVRRGLFVAKGKFGKRKGERRKKIPRI